MSIEVCISVSECILASASSVNRARELLSFNSMSGVALGALDQSASLNRRRIEWFSVTFHSHMDGRTNRLSGAREDGENLRGSTR